MASSIRWAPSPTTIGNEIMRRAASVEEAGPQLASSHAKRGEARMKATGLYQDRTGHLRGGTFGESEGTTIYLGAQASYAPFVILGTSKMAARDFVTPAAEETAVQYFDDYATLVKKLFG